MCILASVGRHDDVADADFLQKRLRIFVSSKTKEGKMNLFNGLLAARFWLSPNSVFMPAGLKRNRPSFTDAAPWANAEKLYNYFIERLRAAGVSVATGRFQARMKVALVDDGSVTFILKSCVCT